MLPQQKGRLLAIAAFGLWGAFPFYFKLLTHIHPLDILANRVLWSVLFLSFIITLLKQWPCILTLLKNTRHKRFLLLATLLIAANWGVYIWAIDSDRIFEASLGYYIGPLVTIFLGFAILKERLNRIQWTAVCLAAFGVGLQIISLGQVPWIALLLGFSFACYGLIHKMINIDTIPGLFVETLFVSPIALLFFTYLATIGAGPVMWLLGDWLILALAGPVTVIPLLLFTAGAKRIPYTEIGFIQYITPSILFILALFFYKEPFSLTKLVTFCLIWLALIIMTINVIYIKDKKLEVIGDV